MDEKSVAAGGPPSAALFEELMGVLMHDLRSPLGALTVYLDVLASQLADDKNLLDIVARAKQAAVKSQLILDDASELGAIYRGSLTTNVEPGDLGHLLDRVAKIFEQLHGEGSVEVRNASSEIACKNTMFDTVRCELVLLRYMEEVWYHSGNTGKVRIEISREDNRCKVIMESSLEKSVSIARSASQLKGRLGNRNAGVVHYNLLACEILMRALGGSVNVVNKPRYRAELIFPVID